ncbi:HAD family phosphatase [uncultured Shewanella sp.]|uniref:HAD family hydrolase n=1 Tax=uncultured Shewanella sp. TaxID=173975 RepID=UPI00260EE02F|nr:HAD family phosphatase [uncultured Shewanella sp.]
MQYKIIFDIGNVLLTWKPEVFITQVPRVSEALGNIKQNHLFLSLWDQFDQGLLSEVELVSSLSQRAHLSVRELQQFMVMAKTSLLSVAGALTLLGDLASSGYALYCITNMSESFYQFLVKRYQFWQYFRRIVVSGQLKINKPDVRIFQYLLNKEGLQAKDCIFIDDKADNIAGASQLGFNTIQFFSTEQLLFALKEYHIDV